MPTKPKNIKSSSKTVTKATKAPAVKKPAKKSPSKKVTVVETVIEDVAVENVPTFVEASTAPTESPEVAVQPDVTQTAAVNTDTSGGTVVEAQTELPFTESTPTPTPTPDLEAACGNECTCSTTEAAPKKDHTKTILIVAGVITIIAIVLCN